MLDSDAVLTDPSSLPPDQLRAPEKVSISVYAAVIREANRAFRRRWVRLRYLASQLTACSTAVKLCRGQHRPLRGVLECFYYPQIVTWLPKALQEHASAQKIPEEHQKIIEQMRKNARSLDDGDLGKK